MNREYVREAVAEVVEAQRQSCSEGCGHPDHRTAAAAVTPEPPPMRQGGREVLPDLVHLLKARSDFGLRKYGVRLHTGNGRNPYHDALQELLDLFVYLHQADMEHAALLGAASMAQTALETRLAEQRALLAGLGSPLGTCFSETRSALSSETLFLESILEVLRGR